VIILCGTLLSIDVISFENIPKGIHSISGVIIFQLNFFKNFLGSNWKVYEIITERNILENLKSLRMLFKKNCVQLTGTI
jgi:hypothetical protein